MSDPNLPHGPPLPVSPLIRILRFGLLVAGIVYGRSKQSMYKMLDARHKEEEAKRKIIRDKEMEVVRARVKAEEEENIRLLETGKLFDPPDK